MASDILDAITQDGINLELLICTDILKLNSLHFGLWNGEEDLSLSNLRVAQARYTENLIALIPDGLGTILDVGCGIGDVARELANRGHAVTAISPDGNHGPYVDAPDNTFHKKRFEELDLDERFDAVLMSESQNYFDADIGFRQCVSHLRRGGYLIVCGMFKKTGAAAFDQMPNLEASYVEKAAQYGLSLIDSTDITEQVLPTMKLANRVYRDHVLPAQRILELYWKRTSRLKRYLIHIYFRKEIERLQLIRSYYEDYIDPEIFRQNVRYLTQRYVYDSDTSQIEP